MKFFFITSGPVLHCLQIQLFLFKAEGLNVLHVNFFFYRQCTEITREEVW